MSFNFIPVTLSEDTAVENLPVLYELARNLDSLELLVKGGKFYTVSKDEALKIWILKALNKQTARYEHRAYSSDYGNEITQLFGRHLKDSLLESELERYVKEALSPNPYIKKISDFTFSKKGSKITLTFTVTSVYGEFEENISL